jgi:hypothetical protein
LSCPLEHKGHELESCVGCLSFLIMMNDMLSIIKKKKKKAGSGSTFNPLLSFSFFFFYFYFFSFGFFFLSRCKEFTICTYFNTVLNAIINLYLNFTNFVFNYYVFDLKIRILIIDGLWNFDGNKLFIIRMLTFNHTKYRYTILIFFKLVLTITFLNRNNTSN